MANLNNAASQAIAKEQILFMAEKEMEYRVELFNKLTQTCFRKCAEKSYKDSELNMAENSCIDKCVSKYWQPKSKESSDMDRVDVIISVTNLVGQLLGTNQPPM